MSDLQISLQEFLGSDMAQAASFELGTESILAFAYLTGALFALTCETSVDEIGEEMEAVEI